MNRGMYRLSSSMIFLALRVLFRLRVSGRENIPEQGACVIVANHSSLLDPLIVGGAAWRPVRFAARDTLEKIPIIGRWMRWVGVIWVRREAPTRSSIKRMSVLLGRGELLSIFPEGTRSEDNRLGRFRRGILLLAKKTGTTVVPAGISGSFRALPPGRVLPRLFRRCEIQFGSPMSAEELIGDGGLEELRNRVAQLSGQTMTGAEEGADAPFDRELTLRSPEGIIP